MGVQNGGYRVYGQSWAGLTISGSLPRVWGGWVSMNEVPKVFPPKKFDTFCTLHLHPKPPKKSVSGKKTQWVFASPVWQQVMMCCSCVTTWSLLRPASSIIRPLYEWSLSAAFENDHYVNSQNIVFFLSQCLGGCVGLWWVTNINLASACVIIFHHGRRW